MFHPSAVRYLGLVFWALCLSACATFGKSKTPQEGETPSIIIASPDPDPAPAPIITTPPSEAPAPDEDIPVPAIIVPLEDEDKSDSPFADLANWEQVKFLPALQAFRRSCLRWQEANPEDYLHAYLPEYGTYADWIPLCQIANDLEDEIHTARAFFEANFIPAHARPSTGLVTGYYQPEINVRTHPDAEFSEPILAVPRKGSVKARVRADLTLDKLTGDEVRIIAYGRPIDVFFMQIQGSGHIRFKNGRVIRAAYAGNNGHSYTSIGRHLIKRGDLNRNQASKQDIETWMHKVGPDKSRELMNVNARYIFFKEQAIHDGEGPLGAMQVPLTDMGSLAIDPRYHPYGVPMVLIVNMPVKKRDYKGEEKSVLLITQDTGSAIKGPFRGDIYFGSGEKAGDLAGVMKHQAEWHILLPRDLHISGGLSEYNVSAIDFRPVL